MTKVNYNKYIEDNTIRCEAGYRGGGIEIDISGYFGIGCKMTAYQNYLGGGMLGAIGNSFNFDIELLTAKKKAQCLELAEALKRYFHDLTNHDTDGWENASYEDNQKRPVSAY